MDLTNERRGDRRERRRPLAEGAALRVAIHRAASPGRAAAEAFVARRYLEAYGARVTAFLPLLLAVESVDGGIRGVIGAREASLPGPLFLEVYLDVPVEEALARAGVSVPRAAIAEVGNLCGALPGGGAVLVATLASYLAATGITHAAFTATTALRNAFSRMGVGVIDLGPADGTRLGPALADWGTYYGTDPRVVAVEVGDVVSASTESPPLARRTGPLAAAAREAAGAGRGSDGRAVTPAAPLRALPAPSGIVP